jgi:hypothetical protein
MRRLFTYGDAPVDEVDLARRADEYVAAFAGRVPTTRELGELTKAIGLDLATMTFYRAVLASTAHGPFVQCVDAVPAEPPARPRRVRLVIVPAMFYRERPDLGGDGSLVQTVARACGYDVEVAPTRSKGALSENAAILRRVLEDGGDTPTWILSLSKGGGEVRLALQQAPDAAAWRHVRGWINVSGIVRGSHVVDFMAATPSGRLRARAICLALGTSYAGVQELRTTHSIWQAPFVPPPRLTVINLVGVPLGCHVQRALVPRYRRLGTLGPNDGFMLLPDTLIQPGAIYPIWGTDHLFRSPLVSPLLYRLFRLLQEDAGLAASAEAREPALAHP